MVREVVTVFRARAALFLSAALVGCLSACAPASAPERVFVDSYYGSRVGDRQPAYDGGAWVYEDAAYLLRYWLGTHELGTVPGSVKLELTARRPLRVDWDESRFVYEDGATSPITHEGVPYAFSLADTELAPQERLVDRAVPRRNLVIQGDRVVAVWPLLRPDGVGKNAFGLNLVVNGETLRIRWEGTRR